MDGWIDAYTILNKLGGHPYRDFHRDSFPYGGTRMETHVHLGILQPTFLRMFVSVIKFSLGLYSTVHAYEYIIYCM